MEARITQGALLKKVFDAIKEMVPEVNLECSSSGIQLQAMDSSHVSLVSLDLKDRAFDQYACSRGRCLGLNMAAVAKVFKLCGNDDAVVIRHDDNAETVSFVFEALNEDRVSDFDITLMQIDQEHLGVPESEFSATVSLPSKQFQRICADLGQFADSLSIEVSSKSVKFSTRGDLVGGNITLKPRSGADGDDRVEVEADGNVQLLFAVRYLNYFAKATPLSSQVQLRLSQGQPLEVTFNLHDDPSIGHLRFYLAPKVDETEGATQGQED